MSKEELVKLKAFVDFRCNPTLEIINLNEEVEDNKVNSFNKKETIEIGKEWSSMNFFSSEPFWCAEVILRKNDLSKEYFMEKSKKLYEIVFNMIKEGKETFSNNVDSLKIPDNDYFADRYNKKINEFFWKEIPLDKFKEIVLNKVYDDWRKKFEFSTIDKRKAELFIKMNLDVPVVEEYLNYFKVLKIKDKNVCFDMKKDYEMMIKNITSFIVDNLIEKFFDILEQNH